MQFFQDERVCGSLDRATLKFNENFPKDANIKSVAMCAVMIYHGGFLVDEVRPTNQKITNKFLKSHENP